MFPAINTWMGGSFPALLSGSHSSCDQDGEFVVLFFNFVSLSVIFIDLNINIDLMFILPLQYFAQKEFFSQ